MVAIGDDVGTLQGLRVEAEDVVYDKDAVFGGRVACDIFLFTTILALGQPLCACGAGGLIN